MRRWIGWSVAALLAAGSVGVMSAAEAKPDGGGGGRMGGRAGGGGGLRSGGNRGSAPRERSGRDVGAQRHRDRDGDGRGDRHRRPRWRSHYPFWPYYGGFYGGSFGYRSPFYDPFYSPFYAGYRERDDRDDGKGNVEVKVSPKDAEVYANGVRYGKGRARFNLPVGSWKIELRAPGHVPQVIDLDVQTGIKYSIQRSLEKDKTVRPDGKPLKVEDL